MEFRRSSYIYILSNLINFVNFFLFDNGKILWNYYDKFHINFRYQIRNIMMPIFSKIYILNDDFDLIPSSDSSSQIFLESQKSGKEIML